MRQEMRKCRSCQLKKPNNAFSHRGGKRSGLQADCKTCCVERTKRIRNYNRQLLARWKMLKGCSFCNFIAEHSCQLDIDHVDKTNKDSSTFGRGIEPSWSKKRIKKELSKCQVLCKNCHAEKTFLNKEHI